MLMRTIATLFAIPALAVVGCILYYVAREEIKYKLEQRKKNEE